MKTLALLLLLPVLITPVLAEDEILEKFLPATDGVRACWGSDFPDRPAGQKVTAMQLNMQVEDDRQENDRFLWNFELVATQTDSPKASGIGNCLSSYEGEPISCGIECDGGGVHVTLLPSGNISVDLEAVGYIRLLTCGAEGERVSLKSGPHDKVYELAALPVEQCPEVINHGDDLLGLE
jgi:hypothetical protein